MHATRTRRASAHSGSSTAERFERVHLVLTCDSQHSPDECRRLRCEYQITQCSHLRVTSVRDEEAVI